MVATKTTTGIASKARGLKIGSRLRGSEKGSSSMIATVKHVY
jgi:hypothetical protein